MTEEIIIDGVNVAKCEHFKINRGFNCHKGYNCTDKECSDCYYKQLKRLEQENKELKEMLSKEPKAMQAFQISYNGLKRDNEVLWGMVKDYKTALEEIRKVINLAYKTEDYLLGQDYTDLVDRIEKELEVLQ